MLELSEIAKCDISYVKKANCLIQVNRYMGKDAGKSLTLLQAKIIAYSLSLLDVDTELSQDNILERLTVRFTIPSFWETCGISARGKKYYTMVGEALQDMRDRSAWMLKVNEITGRKEAVTVSWVLKAKVLDDKTTCEVIFDPDLAPALLNLKDKYTQYPLDTVMYLKSKYGFYLYDLLCSYEGMSKEIRIEFHKLTELIDATQYTMPSQIWQKVIKPAIDDINLCIKSDMHIETENEKTGNKTTHVIFRISRGNEKSIPAPDNGVCKKLTAGVEETILSVKEQIGYDSIYADMMANTIPADMQTLDIIVDLLTETLISPKETYSINQNKISGLKVQEKLKTVTDREVRYVLECIRSVTETIRHPKSYLRSALYNATQTVAVYETSKITANERKAQQKKVPTGGTGELGQAELEAIFNIMGEEYPTQGALSNEGE